MRLHKDGQGQPEGREEKQFADEQFRSCGHLIYFYLFILTLGFPFFKL